MRIAIIVYMLLITLPAWAGTFRDDFEDGNIDDWELFDHGPLSQWHSENGKLIGAHPGGMWRGAFLLWGGEQPRDYTIEFRARIVKPLWDNNYVISGVVRYTVNGFVYFGITSPDKEAFIGVWDFQPDQKIDEKRVPHSCEVAKWYRLRADITGKTVKLLIDGKLVMEYQHPSVPENGRMGVALIGAEAQFDNVVIAGVDIPDVGPREFAVDSVGKLAAIWGQIRSK
ncbi:family 16 glycoside hydrolase [Candidatus Poribacteria bacterium]